MLVKEFLDSLEELGCMYADIGDMEITMCIIDMEDEKTYNATLHYGAGNYIQIKNNMCEVVGKLSSTERVP